MKKKIIYILFSFIIFSLGFLFSRLLSKGPTETFQILPTPTPTPLAVYSLDNLSNNPLPAAEIKRGDTLNNSEKFDSFLFSMEFMANPSKKDMSTTTGVLNIPNTDGKYPLVVMFRGYVDPSIYQSGVGTKNAATYFANNGFITIAPDFLGYAGSSSEAGNIFESRFQTYTTAASLLSSIATPGFDVATNGKWDGKNIFFWAHSNGGHIALTLLSLGGDSIPTTLWAPVTKPFPYSILYFTDESIDGGKFIRRELSKFEQLYDVDDFTFVSRLDKIKAKIILHQGSADTAVPVGWSRDFYNKFKKIGGDIELFVYPGADHNMRPSWDTVVERDLSFFKENLR